jgi:LysM repeat protein
MNKRYSMLALGVVGVWLAACTLSLTNPGGTPTAVLNQGAGDTPATGGQPGADATMFALGTSLAATQQAQQTGGGQQPEATQGPAAVSTATPTQLTGAATATTAPTVAATATAIAQATPTKAAVTGACTSPYTVQRGDWIYKIARACNLTPQAIIAANPGINPNRLEPGQKLNLPGGTAPPAATTQAPSTACKGSYTVKRGDNLFRIGFNCGFTTEQMARKNNIAAPYRIFPGQVLQYP